MPLDNKLKFVYAPLRIKTYETNVFSDTGAVQSTMSESEFRKVTIAHPETTQWKMPAPETEIK